MGIGSETDDRFPAAAAMLHALLSSLSTVVWSSVDDTLYAQLKAILDKARTAIAARDPVGLERAYEELVILDTQLPAGVRGLERQRPATDTDPKWENELRANVLLNDLIGAQAKRPAPAAPAAQTPSPVPAQKPRSLLDRLRGRSK